MRLLSRRISGETAIITILITITILARILSFGYFSSLSAANPVVDQYPIVSGDSEHYAALANGMLTLGGYEEVSGVPFRSWPPGYPTLLALVKVVTGSMTPVVLVQIFFAALAVFLLYRMARTLMPVSFALIPALVYAIDPMIVFSDTSVRTDGIFTALIILTVYLAFFQTRLKGTFRWALVGVLLGVATMIRPIGEFLVLVFPAFFLFNEWMSGVRQESSHLRTVGACLLGFIIVVSPWVARNEIHFDSLEISNLGGHNLLTYDVRGFLAWRALEATRPMPALLVLRHVGDPVFVEVDKKIAQDLAALTPSGGNEENYEGALAISYIFHDPVRYGYFHMINTIPFFISSSVASYRQLAQQVDSNEGFYAPTMLSLQSAFFEIRHPHNIGDLSCALWSLTPTALEILWWVLVLLFAMLAFVLRRKESKILLCAVLVAYFAFLTGPMSASRYRIPAEPYLLILAAAGAHVLVQRLKDRSGTHPQIL